MKEQPQWAVDLVNDLLELAKPKNPNRAALAHLRRGLGGSLDYTLARVGWLFRAVRPDQDDRVLDSAILAAGLFAWVKGDCLQEAGVNFGEAFGARLSQEEKEKREKRFVDLLDTSGEELRYKLRQAITLIGRDRIPFDWVLLIRHLIHWQDDGRWVQKEWARRFWSWSSDENKSESETVETTA